MFNKKLVTIFPLSEHLRQLILQLAKNFVENVARQFLFNLRKQLNGISHMDISLNRLKVTHHKFVHFASVETERYLQPEL